MSFLHALEIDGE